MTTYTHTGTIELDHPLPQGMRIKRIGKPKKGEAILLDDGLTHVAGHDYATGLYIILEPIPLPFEVPAWCRWPWFARDENGGWFGYENEPLKRDRSFGPDGGEMEAVTCIANNTTWDFPNPQDGDWRESKFRNPHVPD